MKKFIFTLLCLLSLTCFFNVSEVKASSPTYMRILKNDAYVYQDVNLSSKLFIIPYGYFVIIEKDFGTFVKISYFESTSSPTIIGYMYKDDLSVYASTPTTPFCNLTVTTKFSDILFNDCEKSIPYFNVATNSELTYYGELVTKNNEVLIYCYYNSKLGYIDKNSLNSYQVPPAKDSIASLPQPPSQNDKEESEITPDNGFNVEKLQIIIIVGISVISISVVYFLFKPTKNKVENQSNSSYEYFEE